MSENGGFQGNHRFPAMECFFNFRLDLYELVSCPLPPLLPRKREFLATRHHTSPRGRGRHLVIDNRVNERDWQRGGGGGGGGGVGGAYLYTIYIYVM